MSAIMQGTTPSLTITIDPEDFLLSDVEKLELYIQNRTLTTYTAEDLTIDTTNNTITKTFTEQETSAFTTKYPVVVQARFWFSDNSVVGINKITFNVSDMLGV